jgi:membrane-bound lytic murein transglycosylase A
MHRFSRALLLFAALCLSACKVAERPPIVEVVRYEPVSWTQIEGWQADDAREAWSAFLQSCNVIGSRPDWQAVCKQARAIPVNTAQEARAFFEAHFSAYQIALVRGPREKITTGLITGYYEPLLRGSRTPSAQFPVPLYAAPDDLLTIELADLYPELKGKRVRGRIEGKKIVPYPDRARLANHAPLKGKELVWVDSAVDAFFLEIQGSGRVQLSTGETIRLAYSDQNGHPYRAIGRHLVDLGELTVEEATAPGIRAWLAQHPERVQEVLNANPSAVFFRAEPITDPAQGPKGALQVPLTPGRSIAVDPTRIPMGAPVFLSTTHPESTLPLQRLVLAQDTGGAIRGAIRADLFWGFGAAAGDAAGRMRQQGQMWLLLPKGMSPPDVS